jgi:hypothetical protein
LLLILCDRLWTSLSARVFICARLWASVSTRVFVLADPKLRAKFLVDLDISSFLRFLCAGTSCLPLSARVAGFLLLGFGV